MKTYSRKFARSQWKMILGANFVNRSMNPGRTKGAFGYSGFKKFNGSN